MNPFLILLMAILVITTFLLIPVHLKMQLLKDTTLIRGFYKVVWLGMILKEGGISPEEHPGLEEGREVEEPRKGTKNPSLEPKERPEYKEKGIASKVEQEAMEGITKSGPNHKEIDAILNALPALLKMVEEFIKTFKVKELSLNLCMGIGDAADTARINGYIWSMAAVILPQKMSFSLEPYFLGDKLEGSMIIDIGARPLWVAWVSLKAIKEEPLRNLIISMARRSEAQHDL